MKVNKKLQKWSKEPAKTHDIPMFFLILMLIGSIIAFLYSKI